MTTIPRKEDASSSRVAVDVPYVANDKDKVVTEEDVRANSDMDLDELRMIDKGLTQLEVRLEGGSKTIAIPMDRNLLVDIDEIVLTLGPLFSEIEGTTLERINDNTLSNNIAGLALRVSTTVVCSFLYASISFVSFNSFSLFCRWLF